MAATLMHALPRDHSYVSRKDKLKLAPAAFTVRGNKGPAMSLCDGVALRETYSKAVVPWS